MSASANQFRDGSAANSANLPFFSELSCFWTRRASQDTKKGSLVTLIALLHITDNWCSQKNVPESKERERERERERSDRSFCTCTEHWLQNRPNSNYFSSDSYNLWEKRMKDSTHRKYILYLSKDHLFQVFQKFIYSQISPKFIISHQIYSKYILNPNKFDISIKNIKTKIRFVYYQTFLWYNFIIFFIKKWILILNT